MKLLKSYMYGSTDEAAKEAALRDWLDTNPKAVHELMDDTPVLVWAMDFMEVEGDLGRKAAILAEMLVLRGAGIHGQDSEGKPWLVHYAMFAKLQPMQFLLRHGVDANSRDASDGRTALHWVALLPERDLEDRLVQKHRNAAALLLAAAAKVDACDSTGRTPLHAAAFLGNLKMASFLLEHGASMNLVDNDGYSVLGSVLARQKETWASDQEKLSLLPVVELLYKLGALDIQP